MNNDLQAVEAFKQWYYNKPEPHISAPKACSVVQDNAVMIWLNAWRACEAYRKKYPDTPECDALIQQILAMKQFDNLFEMEDFAKTLLRNL